MPGTPFVMPPAMRAAWDRHHYIRDLPHAGGDPVFAAERISSANVRLLDVGEKIRKPACTVEVGGRNFEITNPTSGRKPNERHFSIAHSSLKRDLPIDGWVDTPVDMAAMDEEKESFDEFCKALSLRILGDENPLSALMAAFSVSPYGPPPGTAKRYDVLREEGRVALRDEYARKILGL